MNIKGTSNMKVIAKTTTSSKDGKNTYFKLGIMVGSECGMISCSEDIYKQVEEGKSYTFETAYNDQYKSFRLSELLSASK